MTSDFIRRQSCEDTDTQGKHHVITDAEIGMIHLQVKEH